MCIIIVLITIIIIMTIVIRNHFGWNLYRQQTTGRLPWANGFPSFHFLPCRCFRVGCLLAPVGVGLYREFEDHYGLWLSICGMVVKTGNRCGMLDNMSGNRGDTPLMKAAANGNLYMVPLSKFMAGTGRGRVGG